MGSSGEPLEAGKYLSFLLEMRHALKMGRDMLSMNFFRVVRRSDSVVLELGNGVVIAVGFGSGVRGTSADIINSRKYQGLYHKLRGVGCLDSIMMERIMGLPLL
jgi:hypothetical protein